TDTVRKEVAVAAAGFTVGGMAKGAAMLAPDMATMLAVLTTDAAADPATVQRVLARAVVPTFNAMTVDGCTSTNDTVLLLAGGVAGPVAEAALEAAVTEACASLAGQMAADAEGATKVARITVAGARTDGEAHRAARRVADSLLVKCSLNGADPYWGRVVSELGSAGVGFDPDLVGVAYGGMAVCVGGVAAEHDTAAVAAHMAGRHVEIACDLGLGTGSAAVLATDLGHGYIDENRTTS
ncbi:MAG: bifunctional ornithine acetyltransferase/N-acetylglutamate synthase, partial [Acidimicrobiales bacterium]